MKTFAFTLVALFTFTFCSAQSAEFFAAVNIDDKAPKSEETVKLTQAEAAEMAVYHNQLFSDQVKTQLAARLSYPESMQDTRIEEIVSIKVSLSETGTLENIDFLTKTYPAFEQEIYRALANFNKVIKPQNLFYGSRELVLDVQFIFE